MAISPTPPQAIHHLAIQCHDVRGMVHFYEQVLRLPVVRRWPDKNHHVARDRSVWMGVGASFIALERVDDEAEPSPWRSPTPCMHLVALQIFPWNRQLWRDHLALHDVPIVLESQWTLYVRDPEGNRVGLSHFPDEETASQRTTW